MSADEWRLEWATRDFSAVATPMAAVTFTVKNFSASYAGGPLDAQVEASGPIDEIYRLGSMLRYGVRIVHASSGQVAWHGYLHAVDLQLYGWQISVTLDEMANTLIAAYTRADGNQEAIGESARMTMTVGDNGTDSIAQYGRKDVLLSLGSATTEEVITQLTRIGEQVSYPKTIPSSRMPRRISRGDARATLKLYGWYKTLGWRVFGMSSGRIINDAAVSNRAIVGLYLPSITVAVDDVESIIAVKSIDTAHNGLADLGVGDKVSVSGMGTYTVKSVGGNAKPRVYTDDTVGTEKLFARHERFRAKHGEPVEVGPYGMASEDIVVSDGAGTTSYTSGVDYTAYGLDGKLYIEAYAIGGIPNNAYIQASYKTSAPVSGDVETVPDQWVDVGGAHMDISEVLGRINVTTTDVTSGYTRNIDYAVDSPNGRIKALSTGTIPLYDQVRVSFDANDCRIVDSAGGLSRFSAGDYVSYYSPGVLVFDAFVRSVNSDGTEMHVAADIEAVAEGFVTAITARSFVQTEDALPTTATTSRDIRSQARKIAQRFTVPAGIDWKMGSITVYLQRLHATNPTGTVWVGLYAHDATNNRPGGWMESWALTLPDKVGSMEACTARMTTPKPLYGNVTYWLVVEYTQTTGIANPGLAVGLDDEASYASESTRVYDGTSWLWLDPDVNMVFTIGGVLEMPSMVQKVLNTAGQFFMPSLLVDTRGVSAVTHTSQYLDEDSTGLDVMDALHNVGMPSPTGKMVPFRFEVVPNSVSYKSPLFLLTTEYAPDETAYMLRLHDDNDLRMVNTGERIEPWRVNDIAGRWVRFDDLIPYVTPLPYVTETLSAYIEQAEYDTESGDVKITTRGEPNPFTGGIDEA